RRLQLRRRRQLRRPSRPPPRPPPAERLSLPPVTEPAPSAPEPGAAPKKTRRPRSLRFRIIFGVLSTLVSVLLAAVTLEVYLRLRLPPESDQPSCYQVDFDLGKRLVPGFKGDNFGQPLSVNSFGMRDTETTLARRPGSKRILAVGDSWTFG